MMSEFAMLHRGAFIPIFRRKSTVSAVVGIMKFFAFEQDWDKFKLSASEKVY